MSACDITGLFPTAFDHKQITLKTCLIKTCLYYIICLINLLVDLTCIKVNQP